MSAVNDLWRLTATELVAGYGAGRFLPSQALAACLARCQQVNPTLNALIAIDADGAGRAAALSDARWRAGKPLGPLDGVPVTIKDNLHVLGLPTRWGSRALAGVPADHDELPVARLRAAGALIFGKTNVPEFTMQGYTDNLVFGPSRNPWNPALTPGGSSGGAVALVAAGGCPLALGTDGGGSIRRPASHTHTVGYKPSRGRVPRADGLPAIFLDYEVAGPMARSVGDVIAAMTVLSPPDASDASSAPFRGRPLSVPDTVPPGCRVLYVPTFADHPVDPEIAALTRDAAQRLASLGHSVTTCERFDLAEAVNARWPGLSQTGLAWMVAHPDESPSAGHAIDPSVLTEAMSGGLANGRAMSGVELFGLLFEIERLRRRLSQLFDSCDLILTPAAAALPWPAAQSHPPSIAGRAVGPRGHAIFTAIANATGLPAIALPIGLARGSAQQPVQGLPVGMQLIAREGEDNLLLAVARQYESAYGWPRLAPLDS